MREKGGKRRKRTEKKEKKNSKQPIPNEPIPTPMTKPKPKKVYQYANEIVARREERKKKPANPGGKNKNRGFVQIFGPHDGIHSEGIVFAMVVVGGGGLDSYCVRIV
ncbi:hypothetical protein C7212DRAFT_327679 [Tuber magnatum]|uniref:Uncharacterized protein n=1 Tax=Tuber magnatum TaxID=42249 RepID=A0A317SM01_9PEZI|nr:hypothetical protein C7212DRAFT_327679 [Tuber magnatum]